MLCQYLNHLWITYVAIHVNTNYADYGNLGLNFQQNAILLIWLYLLMLCEYLSICELHMQLYMSTVIMLNFGRIFNKMQFY